VSSLPVPTQPVQTSGFGEKETIMHIRHIRHIRKTRSNQIITCRPGQTLAASGLLATLLVGCVSPIDAPPQETAVALSAQTAQGSFDARLRQAEFIFQGVVTDVTYARSQPTDLDGDRLPHTFVTFQIERIFKGRAVGNTVTLRLLGGQRPDGSYMMSSAAPLFDVGERSILLVRGNGEAKTPLVGFREGRFRIVAGAVYSDAGQEIHLGGDGPRAGRKHALEEVLTHRVAGTSQIMDARLRPDLRPVLSGSADRDDTQGPPALPPAPVPGASLADFSTWLATAIERANPPGALAAAPAVRSADPALPFPGPSLRPIAPPSIP
jgi:hypothetical protein